MSSLGIFFLLLHYLIQRECIFWLALLALIYLAILLLLLRWLEHKVFLFLWLWLLLNFLRLFFLLLRFLDFLLRLLSDLLNLFFYDRLLNRLFLFRCLFNLRLFLRSTTEVEIQLTVIIIRSHIDSFLLNLLWLLHLSFLFCILLTDLFSGYLSFSSLFSLSVLLLPLLIIFVLVLEWLLCFLFFSFLLYNFEILV